MQFRLVVDVPNQAARSFSWLRAASPAAGARGPHASREKREIARTERIYGGAAATGSATATDVQLLVELIVQFLLLGIVDRHLLLLGLLRRSARRKMLGARLQMADGCGRHRGWDPREWFGIDRSAAENHDTADSRDSKKRAHGLLH